MTLPIVTMATLTQCPHGVPGQLATSNAKVLVDGAPALVMGDRGTVAGCPFTLPNAKPQPCVTELLTGVSTKVMADGKFVLLMNPSDICLSAEQIPQGPVIWTMVQSKVIAS
jgi:hypothetical protein